MDLHQELKPWHWAILGMVVGVLLVIVGHKNISAIGAFIIGGLTTAVGLAAGYLIPWIERMDQRIAKKDGAGGKSDQQQGGEGS